MIFYCYCSRYFLLTKITTPLAQNLRFIGESAYEIVHKQDFNPILIDQNQAIVLRVDCIPSKFGKSPAFSSISEKRMAPSRSITNDARFETPFIL
jgi:hypothetical protein